MKKNYLPNLWLFFCSLATLNSFGQLTITSGIHLNSSGQAQVVLENTDIVNNGIVNHNYGTIKLTGSFTNTVSGSGMLNFYNLQLAKSAGTAICLSRNIGVKNQLLFASGLLNLNGYEIDLLSTGALVNETEISRITGLNGGNVKTIVLLNAPQGINPGNLGAVFTSTENFGSVVIQRGHASQINDQGSGSSILRYYDIHPTNNSALKATLRFTYFDAELNGITESGLALFKGSATGNWEERGYTTRDAAQNYVEKTNLPGFSRWTLSNAGNVLAASCPDGASTEIFYADTDGDGFGNPNNTIKACSAPLGYVNNKQDCNDDPAASGATIHPGATEICNSIDDDCDGLVDEVCNNTSTDITINDVTVFESQGTAQLTVTLSAASTSVIKIRFNTINGTAVHPKDYLRTSGELIFAPGEISKTVTTAIIKDNKIEPSEYFNVQLSNPVNALINNPIGRVTILEGVLTDGLSVIKKAEPVDKNSFDVLVSNNPTNSMFRIQVQAPTFEPVHLFVTDNTGRRIEVINGLNLNQPIFIGKNYLPGIYFAEVRQGNNRKIVKLLKL